MATRADCCMCCTVWSTGVATPVPSNQGNRENTPAIDTAGPGTTKSTCIVQLVGRPKKKKRGDRGNEDEDEVCRQAPCRPRTFSCLTLRLMLFKIIASNTGAYTCDSTLRRDKKKCGHAGQQAAGVCVNSGLGLPLHCTAPPQDKTTTTTIPLAFFQIGMEF